MAVRTRRVKERNDTLRESGSNEEPTLSIPSAIVNRRNDVPIPTTVNPKTRRISATISGTGLDIKISREMNVNAMRDMTPTEPQVSGQYVWRDNTEEFGRSMGVSDKENTTE